MRRLYGIAFTLALSALCVVGIGSPVHAQSGDPARRPPPVILTDAQSEYSLAPHLEILRDPSRSLTLRDVTAPANADRFIPNIQDIPNLGLTGDAVWVRWRVRNDSALSAWRLALHEARMGQIELYLPSPGVSEYSAKVAGRDLPFAARELPYREFVFQLDLPRGTEQTIYLRLTSTSPLLFPLTLSTADVLAQEEQQTLLFLGLFYGAMLIMAGYNLFLFFSLRESNYLYLALFIAFYSLSAAVRNGLAQQYLWPSLPNPFFLQLLTALVLTFQIKFTTGILEIRVRVPKLYRLFDGLVMACLVVAALSLLVSVNALMNLLTALTLVSEGIAAFIVWRQGYRAARLYLVSWVLLLVSALAFVFSNLNLLSAIVIPESVVIIATAVGALFGSLAIADRVNLLKVETESANRQLTTANQRLERSERKYRSLFENSRDAIFMTTREGKVVDLNPAGFNLFGYDRTELKEVEARQVYADPSDREQIARAMETNGFVQDYPVRLRRKDGGEIDTLITSSLWQDGELNETGYQGIVRDVTERLRIEAELEQHRHHLEELVEIRTAEAAAELAERKRAQEALQRRVGELSTLNEIALTVSAVTDVDSTLQDVARSVADLFGASATIITMLDRVHAEVKLFALYPQALPPAERNQRVFALDDVPLFRRVIDQAKPLTVTDAQNNLLLTGMRDLLQALGTQTLLAMPLRVHGDVIGVMTINNHDGERVFNAEEVNLAETVASVIAAALENLRLYQHAQVMAVEQERHRLARELHDSVIQILYSTVLMASGWRMMAEQERLGSADAALHFQQLAEQSEQALKEMRLLLFQLRPAALEQVGLARALQQRLDAVERRVSIETSLVTTGDWDDLPPRVEEELYAIAQEALNNALRHSHAKAIVVRLERRDHSFELSVEDNGISIGAGASSGGMGLSNMRERAQEIGAAFSITTSPRQGSKIRIRFELEPNDET